MSAVVDQEAIRTSIDVPDGWQQGRGAYGGLVTRELVRAAAAAREDDSLAVRSMLATLAGPVLPGLATIDARVERRGKHTDVISVRMEQGGELKAMATCLFGRQRSDDVAWCDLARPEAPPWREVPVAPVEPPLGPPFARHVEYRIVSGVPFSGTGAHTTLGYIRVRERSSAPDASLLPFYVDAWWPACAPALSAPRPMATISFSMQWIGGWEGLDPDAPLLLVGEAPVVAGGYVTELRQLWGEDGRLMALNQQTIAIIR